MSGVASLFTVEFYRMARRHLERDGVLVQWVQLYETEVALLASVIGALAQVFPDYVIYTPNDKDLLIVAGEPEVLARPLADVFRMPGLAKELQRVNVQTIGDLDMRRLGGRRALEPLFASYAVPANSDYYPYLDLNAPRLRFLKTRRDRPAGAELGARADRGAVRQRAAGAAALPPAAGRSSRKPRRCARRATRRSSCCPPSRRSR